MRATELKYNRRLHPPNAAEKRLESNIQQTKAFLEEVAKQYIKEKEWSPERI